MHSMLWHADIQNITVDVTFRKKATGFGITGKNETNDYMFQNVKQKEYKKNPNLHTSNTQIKANSVCYMFVKMALPVTLFHRPAKWQNSHLGHVLHTDSFTLKNDPQIK